MRFAKPISVELNGFAKMFTKFADSSHDPFQSSLGAIAVRPLQMITCRCLSRNVALSFKDEPAV